MIINKKDSIMKRESDIADGIMLTVEDVEGINFPFQIYIPNERVENANVVLAITTPRTMKTITFNDALEVLKDEARITKDGNIEQTKNCKYINRINPVIRKLSSDYKSISIIPCIPRPFGIDSSYLGYKMFNNDFKSVKETIEEKTKFTKEDIDKYENLHNQVYKMIQLSMVILDRMNISHDDKVIVTGYSASSKFSNFFTMLHPEIVKALIAGGTGGNGIIPDLEINQQYPVGVSDISNDPKVNVELFKTIPQFYYIGRDDYNDLTKFKPKWELETDPEKIEKNGIYMKDIDGNTIPKRNDGLKGYHDEMINGEIKHIVDQIPFDKIDYDLDENGNYQIAYDEGYYTVDQIKFIIDYLGDNVQDRFDKIEQEYQRLGVNSTFKKYNGNHQTVYEDENLYKDIDNFMINLSKNNNKKMST